jgi:hypothetical protein
MGCSRAFLLSRQNRARSSRRAWRNGFGTSSAWRAPFLARHVHRIAQTVRFVELVAGQLCELAAAYVTRGRPLPPHGRSDKTLIYLNR